MPDEAFIFIASAPAFWYPTPMPGGGKTAVSQNPRKDRSVPNPLSPKVALIAVLDHAVKPILIIGLCVFGLVFEFLLELPFIAVIGLHRARSGRTR
jgi:hypothetical protein